MRMMTRQRTMSVTGIALGIMQSGNRLIIAIQEIITVTSPDKRCFLSIIPVSLLQFHFYYSVCCNPDNLIHIVGKKGVLPISGTEMGATLEFSDSIGQFKLRDGEDLSPAADARIALGYQTQCAVLPPHHIPPAEDDKLFLHAGIEYINPCAMLPYQGDHHGHGYFSHGAYQKKSISRRLSVRSKSM